MGDKAELGQVFKVILMKSLLEPFFVFEGESSLVVMPCLSPLFRL
jgi:hypothetical protein